MTKFIAALIVIGLVVVGVATFSFLASGPGSTNEQVTFEVAPGKSFHAIADLLAKKGMVTSSFKFRVLAKLTHQDARVKTGEYLLNRGMSPQEVLSTLLSGKSIQYPVTFPEGANIFEMATTLEAKKLYKAEEFLKAVRDKKLVRELLGAEAPSLEGYLFPETYNITRFTPMRELIAAMVQNFKNTYDEIDKSLKASGRVAPLARHELVILASMVEKETGAAEERPMIASVFYNRLKKGMKLQSDPTIIYGIWVDTGAYKNNITKDDIVKSTRYNTYTVPRLPFGPIANPGRESLKAAMLPAQSEYLYFVSHNDGTHAFSKSYEDHLRNVKNFQLNPAAREGKSWRDLKKRAASQTQTQ